ncbi:MAG: nitroreductase family protein [Deltaproteobacteria bacterium]|nr:nitroreductase family protein [Deltaproteobacteria bacterium]
MVDPAGTGSEARIRAILARRSYRSFRADPIPAEAREAIRAVLDGAPSLFGRRSGYAILVDDARAAELPGAVMSGLVGKINPWLLRSRPPAFLVAAGDSSGGLRDGERHWYNADAALAAQLAVLEAAGRGIGSCWVGGFHERSVAEVVRLPAGHRPLAVIPLGFPAVGPDAPFSLLGRGWDAMAQKLISGRRKPLEKIAYRGRFGEPFVDPGELPGAARGVEGGREAAWRGLGASRSCLRFGPRPVGPAELRLLLECARWAPSAENSQIARHVVVEGREAVRALWAAAFPETPSPRADELPALALLELGAPFPVKARTREQPFFLIDVPIAVTNVLVAAADLRLGWQVAFRFDQARAAAHLGVPADHQVVAFVGLGEPGEAPSGAAVSPLDQVRAARA